MANKQIGAKLQELRKKNGLTQKDVYEKLGISQSTFSSWEIGKSEPDAMTFLELCDMYNVKDILSEFRGTSNIINNFYLTDNEKQLITAYRNHPDMQAAVNKMLDIEDNATIHEEMRQMSKVDNYPKTDISYARIADKGQGTRNHPITEEQRKIALEAIAALENTTNTEKNKK